MFVATLAGAEREIIVRARTGGGAVTGAKTESGNLRTETETVGAAPGRGGGAETGPERGGGAEIGPGRGGGAKTGPEGRDQTRTARSGGGKTRSLPSTRDSRFLSPFCRQRRL